MTRSVQRAPTAADCCPQHVYPPARRAELGPPPRLACWPEKGWAAAVVSSRGEPWWWWCSCCCAALRCWHGAEGQSA